jgi:hypothetical protein
MVSARLRPNATIEQVRAEVAALHKGANADVPPAGIRFPD